MQIWGKCCTGFQFHPRVIHVTSLSSVTLNVFLHAKLHQGATESKQVPLVCHGIKSVTQILLALHVAQFRAKGVKRQPYATGTSSS